MFKRASLGALLGACVVLTAVVVQVANASAATLWVSNSVPVSSPGSSCADPGYSTIQAAIDAAAGGARIEVCSGTFVEQLTITKSLKLSAANGAGTAKVVLPATPVDSTTSCDTAPGTEDFQADQDGVSICTAGTVELTGMTFEPKWPAATCYDSLYGILVAGGATLKANAVTIDGAGASPINGCQGGVAIQVGMAWTDPVEVGHAALSGDTISGYQKNGITVDGHGSSAKISNTTVLGAGATPAIAQNGIQVSNGALAKITGSSISGNECDAPSCGADAFDETQATGVLFFGAASGSSVERSTLKENDIGAYFFSTSPTQPHTTEVTISKDVLSSDRYEGVALDQGDASVKDDTIAGPADVGMELFQYSGDEGLEGPEGPTLQYYAPTSSASGDTIEGMSGAAVEVQSDREPADHPGSFTITRSTFTNDAQVLDDESDTFTVVL